ncbi:hypothetical protein NC99_42630 [Sunxiuqinia dokdonensis]|uniref:Uncharacterized protein n=1 Tax=Sunxiuqinia dokdonensis TaxID=1409788 RepID=A0A0L8V392_9BACT|nr:hypothetical protein NC99_42630 [Sunxiuqinia dokdonensis]
MLLKIIFIRLCVRSNMFVSFENPSLFVHMFEHTKVDYLFHKRNKTQKKKKLPLVFTSSSFNKIQNDLMIILLFLQQFNKVTTDD